jgi:hypothetical protein
LPQHPLGTLLLSHFFDHRSELLRSLLKQLLSDDAFRDVLAGSAATNKLPRFIGYSSPGPSNPLSPSRPS